jgi:hypothetical protein
MTMEGDAVGLDDELLARPHDIHLMAKHIDVGDRRRQLVMAAEFEDPIL